MGTRALVGIEREDGTVKTIYSHYDGYPSGVGKTLVDWYDCVDRMTDLVERGNNSGVLKSPKEMNWYGEAGVVYDSIDEALAAVGHSGEEYGYIRTNEGLWVMRDRYAKRTNWDASYEINCAL